MKANKKIAAALAVVMAASSAATLAANAASSVTLSGTKTEAEAGGTFSVDVSLSGIPSTKINVMDFAISYDSSVLTVSDVAIGSSANTAAISSDSTASEAPVFATNIADGAINVSWSTGVASSDWISTDGVILTITGTVASDAKEGTYDLKFGGVSRETYQGSGVTNTDMVIGYIYGNDSEQYSVTTDNGSVTVVSKAAETTTTAAQTTTTTAAATTTTTAAQTTTTVTQSQTTAGVTTPTTSQTTGDVLYGDVNLDNAVDLSDVVVLNKIVSGAVNPSAQQTKNGDVDVSDSIDGSDAKYLLQFNVHVLTALPVQ